VSCVFPWRCAMMPHNVSSFIIFLALGIFPFDTLLRTLLMSMAADLPSGQDLSQSYWTYAKVRGKWGNHHPQMDFPWNSSDQPAKSWQQSAILMKKQYYRVLTYMIVYFCFMNISYHIIIHRDQSPMPRSIKRGFPEANQCWSVRILLASGVTSSCPPSYVCWFQNHLNCSFIHHIYSSEMLAINQLGDSC